MKAHVGDRIIVASPTTGGTVKDGRITEVRGPGGGAPYMVRWADGHTGLYFPGTDAHVSAAQASEPPQPGTAPHVRSWRVDIDLFEAGDDTTAHAVLVAEAPNRVDAQGQAHRKPGDMAVPEIGDEIAVARALRHLADQLLATASSDIAHIEGHQVTLSP
ncbi:MAG TPA: dsRBD fold-containing protein [Dermatophilaceae bacterium]